MSVEVTDANGCMQVTQVIVIGISLAPPATDGYTKW